MSRFARASALGAVLLCACGAAHADDRAERIADFDRFCRFVADEYAYFDVKKTDWPAVCGSLRDEAAEASRPDAFLGVLERALDELYDPHAHLGASTRASHRLVPTDADLHARWVDGRATIVEVRPHSAAEDAGLRPGMVVETIDGQPVAQRVAALEPTHLAAPDAAARDWALDVALAGRQDGAEVVVTTSVDATASPLRFVPDRRATRGPLASRRIGDIGVIALNNALGDGAAVAAFDHALDDLADTRGLVLDLRDTPSGGNTTVARGILGRFVAKESPYQRHERISEWRQDAIRHVWIEQVEPRGVRYASPVVVLVGHWTGSMGEGLAIGFDAAAGATVVGTPMARLLGALDEERLPHSGIVVRIPTEKLSHVDRTPREAFVPCPMPATGDRALALAVGWAARLATGEHRCR